MIELFHIQDWSFSILTHFFVLEASKRPLEKVATKVTIEQVMYWLYGSPESDSFSIPDNSSLDPVATISSSNLPIPYLLHANLISEYYEEIMEANLEPLLAG